MRQLPLVIRRCGTSDIVSGVTEYRRHVRRVLVVTSSYPQVPGDGSGGFVHALNQRLVARGLEVTVLAPASPISESRISDGVDIRFVPYAPRAWQTLAHGSGVLINVRARSGASVWHPRSSGR